MIARFAPIFPLLLVGCSQAPAPVADAAAASAPEPMYSFAVQVADPDSRDPRIVEWVDAECHVVALVSLPRLPVDDPMLRADLVVEFDQQGRELNRWLKPYSAEILTLQGQDLYFGAGIAGARGPFRTDTAGRVVPAAPLVRNLGETTEILDCPDTLTGFDERSITVCHLVTDAAGRRRRLAWETGCA